MNFIFVALGGGIGAMLRYAISLIPFSTSFPILTLITNFLGALMIGFIAQLAQEKSISDNILLFLKTGVCGGFTTFSTFSLESYSLFKDNQTILGILYIFSSFTTCILGVFIGAHCVKLLSS
ncbi:MAG: fluoride efflux transporter CrcB [Lachnospirales bacterium]